MAFERVLKRARGKKKEKKSDASAQWRTGSRNKSRIKKSFLLNWISNAATEATHSTCKHSRLNFAFKPFLFTFGLKEEVIDCQTATLRCKRLKTRPYL